MSVLCECVCECQCVWVCVCMFVCMCLNEVTNSTKSDVLNNKEFYFNNGQEVGSASIISMSEWAYGVSGIRV